MTFIYLYIYFKLSIKIKLWITVCSSYICLYIQIFISYYEETVMHRYFCIIYPQSKNNLVPFPHWHFLDHDSSHYDEVHKCVNPNWSGHNLWTTGERTDTSNYKYVAGELSITNLILLRAKPEFNFKLFLASGWERSFRLLTFAVGNLDQLLMHADKSSLSIYDQLLFLLLVLLLICCCFPSQESSHCKISCHIDLNTFGSKAPPHASQLY